jgi:hypothetical protein
MSTTPILLGGAQVARHPNFQAHLARRAAEATARSWSPDWEAREQERKEARRPLVAFHSMKRKAAKLKRTPAWADMSAIQTIYAEARRMCRETGIAYVVDHVVPLQGETVSGLHVANNLRIITESENCKKHNSFPA